MSQICHIYHIVFCTQYSQKRIAVEHKSDLYLYMLSMASRRYPKAHIIIMNGTANHIHLLVKCVGDVSIPDLVRDLKRTGSYFMKHVHPEWFPLFTKWKSEYASFTCSPLGVNDVVNYIKNQEEHHREGKVRDELMRMCKMADIDAPETSDDED